MSFVNRFTAVPRWRSCAPTRHRCDCCGPPVRIGRGRRRAGPRREIARPEQPLCPFQRLRRPTGQDLRHGAERRQGWTPGDALPALGHIDLAAHSGEEVLHVLEGKLVDKEGPAAGLEVKPGEFVWREAGSRHVAWTPEGGLMLAMFQIPNKFHERDGRVTDLGGQDWESLWAHALKD